MGEIQITVAQKIAQAAIAFQRECTGVAPESVTVLLGEETLVVTLHEAFSPAEKEMARSSEGAARVHEYHRQLFQNSAAGLHQEIQRILGVQVRASKVEMEPSSGRFVEVFPSGDMIQVFQLSSPVPAEVWSSPKKPK